MIGPCGIDLLGVAVTPVSVDSQRAHRVHHLVPSQIAAGTYSLTVGPDVQDWYGNDMNQNRDGVNGQSTDGFVDSISCSTDLLNVAGTSNGLIAGASGTFTVTAMNPSGGTDTGFLGTIELSSTDSRADLPATYTFTGADAGTHTFTVTLKTAGTQAITATDTADEAIVGTDDNIAVQAGTATSLKVAGFPINVTAGADGSVVITAYDAFGNVASDYTGTVSLTSSDARAVLPSSYTFSAADAGKHRFAVGLDTAGIQMIAATDTTTASITGVESDISVQAAAATTLTIAGFPSIVTAGTANQVTVTAYDAYGNVAIGYIGKVSLTSSDPGASLPSSYRFVTADKGTHRFAVGLDTAGTQTITATDMATASVPSSTESGITVRAAPAKTFKVTGFPATDTAGASSDVTVTAYDAYGNVATGYTGTIAFRASDAKALSAAPSFSFVTADAGTHTFSIAFETVGSQSITVSDMANSTHRGHRVKYHSPVYATGNLELSSLDRIRHTADRRATQRFGQRARHF